jgi:hypothetical protein
MHSLRRRQCDLQADPKTSLVRLSACHTNIQGGKEAGEVLDRAGDGKPVRVSCGRFVEEKIKLGADGQSKTLSDNGQPRYRMGRARVYEDKGVNDGVDETHGATCDVLGGSF